MMYSLYETSYIQFLITFILLLSLLFFFSQIKREKRSHTWRKRSAKKAIIKLHTIPTDAQKMVYLRKVDPFVFEEMILESIRQREDTRVIERTQYTGDGGIDGEFFIGEPERKVLIQAKRYTSHIRRSDIAEFEKTIEHKNADMGLFVHTGRTGKQTMKSTCQSKVKVYSGKKMIDLILYGKMEDRFIHL